MSIIDTKHLDAVHNEGSEGYQQIVDVMLKEVYDDYIVLERIPNVYFDAITRKDVTYYLVMTHSRFDKTAYATTDRAQAKARFKMLSRLDDLKK